MVFISWQAFYQYTRWKIFHAFSKRSCTDDYLYLFMAGADNQIGSWKSKNLYPLKMRPRFSHRDAALEQLSEIARYFAHTEPSSPLPCLLKRCVNFGRMSWTELIPAIIQNESTVKSVFEVTGN